MPRLRTRKIIYRTVTVVGGLIWLPLMVTGLIVGIGVLGLFCVVNLLRCISEMPIEHRFDRGFYTVTMLLGVVLISVCMHAFTTVADELTAGVWALLISGTLLVAVALLILTELYGGFAEHDG